MKRRKFIALIGGATVWPAGVRAQQTAMPVIGFLNAGRPAGALLVHASFRDGLKEAGYVEGQNVAFEHRFAEGQFDRMSSLAADLVRRRVTALVVVSND